MLIIVNDMEEKIFCLYCEKNFTLKTNLTRHIKNIHGVTYEGRLSCPECNELVANFADLRRHLQDAHEIPQTCEEYKFPCMKQFESWKKALEESTYDVYVQHFGVRQSQLGKKTYLYCHRSGVARSMSTGVRATKSQGTNKIGKLCTAGMEVFESNVDGSVLVQFWKTHTGHVSEIGRTPLPDEAKKSFTGKLRAGIPLRRILDDIREDSTFSRVTLTEPQDLRNVKRKLLDSDPIYHSNDALSVELFVTELESLVDNPVLLYKRQGFCDASYPLQENDLMIVLMTQFQKQMLQKFGTNKICVDSTHGTNAYDFQLVTVMTIDEFCNGCPVCYCLTNRLDTDAMKYFFEVIKKAAGQINCQVFMSDDAPAFYNAWKMVMGTVENRLLCAWHIDKNLKENLKKISNEEKRKYVYKTIRVLLTETDTAKFDNMLESFLEDLLNDPDTREYYSYFLKYYSTRKREWAAAYRTLLGINTNMHLEAFHKILKYHYFNGYKNHRLDVCLKAILKLARDKIFDRMIKLSKNRYSYPNRSIQRSHNNAQKIDSKCIFQVSETSFLVQSEMDRELEYSVNKKNADCPCGITCKICKICVHAYNCTCPDFTINFNICKHIHACIMADGNCIEPAEEATSAVQNEIENLFQLTHHQNESNNDIVNLTSTIANIVKTKSLSDETRGTVINNLKQVLNILEQSVNETVPRISEPANKKITPQLRFLSTRKKRKRGNTHETPNFSEANNIRAGLLGTVTDELVDDPTCHDHSYQ